MNWKNALNESAAVITRVEAVDLFRFFVLFFMIQGHLFRAYLLPAIRLESWYKLHETLHGLVAPGFLFAAGFAAFLSFHNKRQNYIHFDRAFFKRLRRILFVIAVGYWIHLPFFSLRKTLHYISLGKAGEFLKVDILQCIGVGLLLFTIFAVGLKNEKVVVLVSALAGALFFLLPETVRYIHLHPAIDPYFDYNVSSFPIFPWAGFLFTGVVAAFVYVLLKKEVFFRLVLILGVVLFPWFFFKSSQIYFKAELTLTGNINKIAGVFLLLWLADWLLRRFRGRLLNVLIKAGTESLFIYVLHLFIIFNSIFGFGLKPVFQNSLKVVPALLLFLAIALLVFALALAYNWLKEKQPFTWRIVFNVFWIVFFLLFAIKPH
ncbi:MAG TPA: heparan-alpha-glucosaminide N-acetyltransferase domain-containing protein [Candidatus Binatia bacterium]|nr:heparan-alpha-glucosaminide N-acetyltransferase domain-containing protein [Candidatus Binatia bacterium]